MTYIAISRLMWLLHPSPTVVLLCRHICVPTDRFIVVGVEEMHMLTTLQEKQQHCMVVDVGVCVCIRPMRPMYGWLYVYPSRVSPLMEIHYL